MQHLFDFYCLLCKQGAAGSSPATSTNLFHFSKIAREFVPNTTCHWSRRSPETTQQCQRVRQVIKLPLWPPSKPGPNCSSTTPRQNRNMN